MTMSKDLSRVHQNVLYQFHAASSILCFLKASTYYQHIYPSSVCHPAVPQPLFELLIYLACQQMTEAMRVSTAGICRKCFLFFSNKIFDQIPNGLGLSF